MSPRKAKTPSLSSGTTKTQVKVSSTHSPRKTSSKSSDTTRKGHSRSTSTVDSLEKNLKKLTTSPVKTSTNQRSKPVTTTKSTTKPTKRRKEQAIKVINSRKLEWFPWVDTFPYYLKDETENKRCWFVCEDHATKYIGRYNCKYKLYYYSGQRGSDDNSKTNTGKS